MHFAIRMERDDASFRCAATSSVLTAMQVERKRSIPVGCRGGGCGVCKIQILSGRFETGAMSAARVRPDEIAAGIALACQVFPRSDLTIRPVADPRSNPQPSASKAALARRSASQ